MQEPVSAQLDQCLGATPECLPLGAYSQLWRLDAECRMQHCGEVLIFCVCLCTEIRGQS
jgi:hypothetical protein